MNAIKLKAHIFDAEQSVTWARQAVEESDTAAIAESLSQAIANLEKARAELIDLSVASEPTRRTNP